MILQTEVTNVRGNVVNPTVEILYPVELAKDTVFIEIDGIVIAEDCEYLIQIESYGGESMRRSNSALCFSLGLNRM